MTDLRIRELRHRARESHEIDLTPEFTAIIVNAVDRALGQVGDLGGDMFSDDESAFRATQRLLRGEP